MKFIIDAQLPPDLAQLFQQAGHDCTHTINLPKKNLTSDQTINKLSVEEKLILVTKDTDFFHSYLINKEPYKLVFVTVGNMKLSDVLKFFTLHIPEIITLISTNGMLEVNKEGVKIISE
jgi:predicted nuclease of predicted toxin-antitoxin system